MLPVIACGSAMPKLWGRLKLAAPPVGAIANETLRPPAVATTLSLATPASGALPSTPTSTTTSESERLAQPTVEAIANARSSQLRIVLMLLEGVGRAEAG